MIGSEKGQSLATTSETKLQAELKAIKGQIFKMHTARENSNTPTANPLIISNIQILKERMEEYSNQLQ